MGKHNDKQFTEGFKNMLRGGFKEQYQNGLRQGTYAACKVIHDKAVDDSMTPEERLQKIIEFCEVFASLKQNKGDDAKEGDEDESTDSES